MSARVWGRRVARMPAFAAYFLWSLALANARVAWEALTPGFSMRAGIVRVRIHTRNDWETMLLANAISLTPGTLSLEVSADRQALYIHTLYMTSRAAFGQQIGELERRLLRALR